MNRELLTVVHEDLQYLFEAWNQDIDDPSLRRSSPVLRSLLVDGQLMKVARLLNARIQIPIPAIRQIYTEQELKQFEFYICGGALYKGAVAQASSKINKIYTADERRDFYNRRKKLEGKFIRLKPEKFLRQTSIVSNGTFINKEEIIKYVSNKLGGAHFDSARADRDGKQNELDKKYQSLDKIRSKLSVGNKNAIYYELLSIGQSLINSRDVIVLRGRLEHILSLPSIIYA